jgi:hypothetical protein
MVHTNQLWGSANFSTKMNKDLNFEEWVPIMNKIVRKIIFSALRIVVFSAFLVSYYVLRERWKLK